jgi:hypothetical protein
MFVLNPGGTGESGAGSDLLRQKLWFFGKLGLYFGTIRLAFVFMSGRESSKAIEASK